MMERVALSLDVACFAIVDGTLTLLLAQRSAEPFAGSWALPGGVVRVDERLDVAAQRILEERTDLRSGYLEQLYTFGDPGRDPRGRTISVAYYALLPLGSHAARAGRDVAAIEWRPVDGLPPLAFDHTAIARYALQRLRQKALYAPVVFRVVPEPFTLTDLRGAYEAILGETLHPSNFARRTLALWDLTPVPGRHDRRSRRPAQLYRYNGPREIAGPPSSPAPEGDDTP